MPGHGNTQGTGGEDSYAIAPTATAIVDLLDHLNIPQVYLVGYSMGGRLALYLALHYCDRFPKVLLESASPGLRTEAERVARRDHDFQLAKRLEADFPQFLADWYDQPLFQSLKHHPNFENMLQKRLMNNPMELAKSLRAMSTGMQPSLWKKLKHHQKPMLLIVGARDRKFITINQEMVLLDTAIPPLRSLQIAPNTGHNVHLENPGFVASCIEHFF